MPDFTTVSMTEATLQTSSGRQKRYLAEYIDYIKTLPKGQAGRLSIGEQEKHTTVRRQLVTTAKAMNIPLIVKRSGNDIYFWRGEGEEQPRRKRSYTRRSRISEETPTAEQPMGKPASTPSDDFEEQMTRLESESPNSTL